MKPNVQAISVEIPKALYRLVKLHCFRLDMTVKQFVIKSLANELKASEETNHD
jgi:hypothetical protein